MAHKVYSKIAELPCPRCNCENATLQIYMFGSSYTAECEKCGFGKVSGDREHVVLARYYGKCLEYKED